MSQLPYYKAFIILGVIYFRLCRVSLAEYILVLRVYSHLLQMGRCTMAIVSTACILRWVMLRTMGMVIPYVSFDAFVGDDHSLALYLNSA